MRYLFGLLCVCALSVFLVVGCEVDVGEICLFEPCPNGDDCPLCAHVECEDDGNECTEVVCDCATGRCGTVPVDRGGTVCDFDGLGGVCIEGACEEDIWCEGACDVSDECTVSFCDLDTSTCENILIEDGTLCSGGFCQDGVCDILVDQCTADDLAAIEAGDVPGTDCTGGVAWNYECLIVVTGCLQELSGTSLSTPCLGCYALGACCMLKECDALCEGPPQPGDDCDICIQEYCQPQVDACVGGQ